MITPAQLYYATRIYPEKVTPEEAEVGYRLRVTTEVDRSYWQIAVVHVDEMGRKKCDNFACVFDGALGCANWTKCHGFVNYGGEKAFVGKK